METTGYVLSMNQGLQDRSWTGENSMTATNAIKKQFNTQVESIKLPTQVTSLDWFLLKFAKQLSIYMTTILRIEISKSTTYFVEKLKELEIKYLLWILQLSDINITMISLTFLLGHQDSEDLSTNLPAHRVIHAKQLTFGQSEQQCGYFSTKNCLFRVKMIQIET